jgi:G3E family GTPase
MTLGVTVIGGFLGSGKTTLVRHLLAGSHGKRLGVLVNDFGDLSIDADLISEVNDDTIEFKNGCICCSMRGDLLIAARRLTQKVADFDGLVVEASGVGRPELIARTLQSDDFGSYFTVETLVSLVDCAGFEELDFEAGELALDQAAAADLVLLNKLDLVDDEKALRLSNTLQEAIPHARLIKTVEANIPLELLLGLDLQDAKDRAKKEASVKVRNWAMKKGSAEDLFETSSWSSDALLDLQSFREALEQLPVSLYRLKGFITTKDRPQERFLVQMVGGRGSIEPSGSSKQGSKTSLIAIAKKGTLPKGGLGRYFDPGDNRLSQDQGKGA